MCKKWQRMLRKVRCALGGHQAGVDRRRRRGMGSGVRLRATSPGTSPCWVALAGTPGGQPRAGNTRVLRGLGPPLGVGAQRVAEHRGRSPCMSYPASTGVETNRGKALRVGADSVCGHRLSWQSWDAVWIR